MFKFNPAISHFTPSIMSAETLEQLFVKRQPMLDDLIDRVVEGVNGGSHHHILLLGPRGIGKTHMISMLYHRLNAMPGLSSKCCIAWLVEEEWSVASWLDLLVTILRALLQRNEPVGCTREEFERVQAQLYDLEPDFAETRAESLLLAFLQGRSLVLLMENLDMIFDALEEDGQQRWRAFLQDHANTTIVATSQSLFQAVTHRSRPFYGFFRQSPLEKFSLNDACDMLERIARLRGDEPLAQFIASPIGHARVRAVAHFAGGSPRVFIILSQFLTRETLDDLVQPFMRMLDDLTPYYQSRMQNLSPQQRKLVELLCLARNPLPVKELARRGFITPQTAASQLRKLVELGYLVSREIGRESYYELREPLLRLTIEVKKNRGEPIPLFIDFLRLWYPAEELQTRLEVLPLLGLTNVEEKRYITRALELKVGESEDPRVASCLHDFKLHAENGEWPQAKDVAEELIALRGAAEDYHYRARTFANLGDSKQAEHDLLQAFKLASGDDLAKVAYSLAAVRIDLKDFAGADDMLCRVPEQERGVSWLCLRAITWLVEGRIQEGLNALKKALRKAGKRPDDLRQILRCSGLDMAFDVCLHLPEQSFNLATSKLLEVGLGLSLIHFQALAHVIDSGSVTEDELKTFYYYCAVLVTSMDKLHVILENNHPYIAHLDDSPSCNQVRQQLLRYFSEDGLVSLRYGRLESFDLFWLDFARGYRELAQIMRAQTGEMMNSPSSWTWDSETAMTVLKALDEVPASSFTVSLFLIALMYMAFTAMTELSMDTLSVYSGRLILKAGTPEQRRSLLALIFIIGQTLLSGMEALLADENAPPFFRQFVAVLPPGQRMSPRQWRDLWRTHEDVLPELSPVLRILDVADAFSETHDKRELMKLPLEERMLVAQLLKLTPEESATD